MSARKLARLAARRKRDRSPQPAARTARLDAGKFAGSFARSLLVLRPARTPRSPPSYTNSGYAVAVTLVERVSSQAFQVSSLSRPAEPLYRRAV